MATQTFAISATLDSRNFEAGVRRYLRGLRQMEGGVGDANSSLSGLGSSSVLGGLSSVAMGIAAIGAAAATAAAGGIAAMATASVSMAATFEQSIADIAAVMGKSSGDIGELRGLIMDLSVDPNLKVSATEAAAAAEMLGKNGVTMEQQLDGALRGVIELSNATGEDMALGADIATDAMSVFNIEAAEMGRVADSITGVMTNSKLNLQAYNYAMSNGMANAKNFGMSLEEFNTVLVATASYFPSGMRQGTAFSEMLRQLQAPSDKARKLMNELGFSVANADGTFKPFMQTVEELDGILNGSITTYSEVGGKTEEQSELLKSLQSQYDKAGQSLWEYEQGIRGISQSEEQKAKSIATLQSKQAALMPQINKLTAIQGEQVVSTRQVTDAQREEYKQILLGNTGKKLYNAITGKTAEEMEELSKQVNKEGQAAEAAATRMNTLVGRWEIFKSVLQGVGIEIGTKFLPYLTQLFDVATPMISQFGMQIPGAIDQTKIALMGMYDTFNNLLSIATVIGSGGLAIVFGADAETVGYFKEIDNVIQNFSSMNWTEIFSGLSEGVGGLIVTMAENLTEFLNQFSENIITYLTSPDLQAQIADVGRQLGTVLGQGLMTQDDSQVQSVMDNLITAIARAGAASVTAVVAIGAEFMANIFAGMLEAITGSEWEVMTITELLALMQRIATTINEKLATIGAGFMEMFGQSTLGPMAEDIKRVFDDLYDYLVGNSVVPDLVNDILGWFDTLAGGMVERLGGVMSGIGEYVPDMPELGLSEMFSGEDGGIASMMLPSQETIDMIMETIPQIQEMFTVFATIVMEELTPALSDFVMLVETLISDSLNLSANVTNLLIPTLNLWYTTIFTKLTPSIRTLNTTLVILIQKTNILTEAVRVLTEVMRLLQEQIMEVVGALLSQINASKRATDAMEDEGEMVKKLTKYYEALAKAIREANAARGGGGGGGGAPAGFASGGQFIVPGGYPSGSYGMPIRVHSGELVTVLTKAQTQAWKSGRSVDKSNHISSSSSNVSSVNSEKTNNFYLTVQSSQSSRAVQRSFALMRAKAGA